MLGPWGATQDQSSPRVVLFLKIEAHEAREEAHGSGDQELCLGKGEQCWGAFLKERVREYPPLGE